MNPNDKRTSRADEFQKQSESQEQMNPKTDESQGRMNPENKANLKSR